MKDKMVDLNDVPDHLTNNERVGPDNSWKFIGIDVAEKGQDKTVLSTFDLKNNVEIFARNYGKSFKLLEYQKRAIKEMLKSPTRIGAAVSVFSSSKSKNVFFNERMFREVSTSIKKIVVALPPGSENRHLTGKYIREILLKMDEVSGIDSRVLGRFPRIGLTGTPFLKMKTKNTIPRHHFKRWAKSRLKK